MTTSANQRTSFKTDWLVNGQTDGGSTHTSRAKTAEKKKSNSTVHTVGTIKGMDSPVSTHSIDQFSPTPTEVHADGTVSVKRETAKQSKTESSTLPRIIL